MEDSALYGIIFAVYSFIVQGKYYKSPAASLLRGFYQSMAFDSLPVIRQTHISLTEEKAGKAKAKRESLLSSGNTIIHNESP